MRKRRDDFRRHEKTKRRRVLPIPKPDLPVVDPARRVIHEKGRTSSGSSRRSRGAKKPPNYLRVDGRAYLIDSRRISTFFLRELGVETTRVSRSPPRAPVSVVATSVSAVFRFRERSSPPATPSPAVRGVDPSASRITKPSSSRSGRVRRRRTTLHARSATAGRRAPLARTRGSLTPYAPAVAPGLTRRRRRAEQPRADRERFRVAIRRPASTPSASATRSARAPEDRRSTLDVSSRRERGAAAARHDHARARTATPQRGEVRARERFGTPAMTRAWSHPTVRRRGGIALDSYLAGRAETNPRGIEHAHLGIVVFRRSTSRMRKAARACDTRRRHRMQPPAHSVSSAAARFAVGRVSRRDRIHRNVDVEHAGRIRPQHALVLAPVRAANAAFVRNPLAAEPSAKSAACVWATVSGFADVSLK